MLLVAWFGAYLLRFDAAVPADYLLQAAMGAGYVVVLEMVLLGVVGALQHSWRYTSMRDLVTVGRAVITATAVLGALRLMAGSITEVVPSGPGVIVPYGVIAANGALALLGTTIARGARRLQVERRDVQRRAHSSDGETKRVLLAGAGRAGVMVAEELSRRPELGIDPVGFVDDDPRKQGQNISGLAVLGSTRQIAGLAAEHDVDEVVITMVDVPGSVIRRITERCDEAGLDTKIVPGVYEIVDGRVGVSRIRPVVIEDLLGREPVELDISSVREYVAHETVLVTGAGGSIGAELCRQLVSFQPRRLVLLDRAEPALWAIDRELRQTDLATEVVPVVGDVTDEEAVDQLLLHHRPSIVFHAAAHKHVPMMEDNPGEAIRNNVVGTRVLADRCAERGVQGFVQVSTDKAVNPSSVMGATKRVAERYVQHLAAETGRPWVSVRFGNVLDSTGSVVPVFREQIAGGGPVTVTHEDMQRFFMTIPEAAQLVLQAAALGESGDLMVLDMGEPVSILTLAEDLIRLSGLEPHEDIPIEFIGVRPGEKLAEELHLTRENAERTQHPKVFVSREPNPAWEAAGADLDELAHLCNHRDPGPVRAALRRLVPEMTADDTTSRPARLFDAERDRHPAASPDSPPEHADVSQTD